MIKKISKQCGTTVSQNKSTWFEKSRTSKKLCAGLLLNGYFPNPRNNYDLSSASVVDWHSYLREASVHSFSSRNRQAGVPK